MRVKQLHDIMSSKNVAAEAVVRATSFFAEAELAGLILEQNLPWWYQAQKAPSAPQEAL